MDSKRSPAGFEHMLCCKEAAAEGCVTFDEEEKTVGSFQHVCPEAEEEKKEEEGLSKCRAGPGSSC